MGVIDGCARGAGQTGEEEDGRQVRETQPGRSDAEAHWRAPPQLEPAPASCSMGHSSSRTFDAGARAFVSATVAPGVKAEGLV